MCHPSLDTEWAASSLRCPFAERAACTLVFAGPVLEAVLGCLHVLGMLTLRAYSLPAEAIQYLSIINDHTPEPVYFKMRSAQRLAAVLQTV